jgi:ELWxxDGT repeat protein
MLKMPPMPQPPAIELENPPFRDEQERNENPRQSAPSSKKSKLVTAVQVVGLVLALMLATYNNALLGNLKEPKTETQSLLVESEPFAPFAPCTQGGVRFMTGLDSNDNGVLDANEVQDTTEICHGLRGLSGPQGQPGQSGADAVATLLNVQPLPVGNATCPTGGSLIGSGMDLNMDGVLNESESDDTVTVCNGAIGLTGSNGVDGSEGLNGSQGASALVDKVTAPPYICSDGFLVRFGVDDGWGNGTANNALLEEDEVHESLNFCFTPLRSERITDSYPGIGDSVSTSCDAAAWLGETGRFLHATTDGVHGCELHVQVPGTNGSNMVADLHPNGDALPGRDLGLLLVQNGKAVVFDADDGVNGRQLWVSDGTETGTFALGAVEISPPQPWMDGQLLRAVNGSLLWTNGTQLLPWTQQPAWNLTVQASVEAGIASLNQLGAGWLHTGPAGVWMSAMDAGGEVEPIFVGNDGSVVSWDVNPLGSGSLAHLVDDGDDLYAVAVKGAVKQLLHLASDGGMAWLTSLAPSSGDTRMGEGMGLHLIGENLVYDAAVSSSNAHLWTTNIANGITVQLSTNLLAPGAQMGVASTGERLLFDCVTATLGTELCVTDATPLGTRVLHDLTPGVLSSDLRGAVAVGDGWLVLSDGRIEGSDVGVMLWAVEGNALRPVYNPWPGSGNSSEAFTYGSMVVSDSQVFFIAHDGSTGHEWHRWSHGELSDDWIVIQR